MGEVDYRTTEQGADDEEALYAAFALLIKYLKDVPDILDEGDWELWPSPTL